MALHTEGDRIKGWGEDRRLGQGSATAKGVSSLHLSFAVLLHQAAGRGTWGLLPHEVTHPTPTVPGVHLRPPLEAPFHCG